MPIHYSINFWIFFSYLSNHFFFVFGNNVFLHNLLVQLVHYLLCQVLSFLCPKQFPDFTDFPLALVLQDSVDSGSAFAFPITLMISDDSLLFLLRHYLAL